MDQGTFQVTTFGENEPDGPFAVIVADKWHASALRQAVTNLNDQTAIWEDTYDYIPGMFGKMRDEVKQIEDLGRREELSPELREQVETFQTGGRLR